MSKRRELIERRREQERRQTLIILVAIAAIAVLLIGGAVVLSNQQAKATANLAAMTPDPRPTPPGAQANDRSWGPANAPIQVQEWLDYQCPSCDAYTRNYEQGVIDAFAKTGKVRYEVHSLSFIGQESVDAAQAALCAMDQDKFWQMHATLFVNQWGAENSGNFSRANLQTMASKLGLDTGAFNACVDAGKYESQIQADANEGTKLGVNQTPTFVVNGKVVTGVNGADDFRRVFAQVAPDVKLTQ